MSDDSVLEIEEAKEYFLNSEPCFCDSTIYWGERQLISPSKGTWAFSTGHWIGDSKLTIQTGDKVFYVSVRVKPRKEKLSGDLWAEILHELDSWLSGVTVGVEGGKHGSVGTAGTSVPFIAEALIPLLPSLYDAYHKLIDNLRQMDFLVWEEVPLRMMRRVDRQTLKWVSRHPDAALALDPWKGMEIKPPWLPRQHTVDEIDHPANRYVAWVISRVERTICNTADALETLCERSVLTEDAREWCLARGGQLRNGAATLHNMRLRSPLAHLRKEPATEAAFQVVIDDPIYARVHKIGRLFLNPLFKLQDNFAHFQAAVRPSFSIYELWCFFTVIGQLKALLKEWTWTFSGQDNLLFLNGTGEGAIAVASSSCGSLTVHFNPSFSSLFSRGSNQRWSISGERRPDIVVTYALSDQEHDEGAWLCLDAKYRVGRQNLFDAFDSVHIYRDSLRYDGYGGECRACLLLSPSQTEDTNEWFAESFINRYRAGVWELRPGKQNTGLALWICGELGLHLH